MKQTIKRMGRYFSVFSVLLLALGLAGCGGGSGELSTEVVSGVAAVGLPLTGEVTLKDASDREKVAVIDKDGSFAFDVTDMKAPFVLRAKGSAEGKEYKLHSFAEKSGIANVNPLSDAIVASAAEVDDPSEAYEDHDGKHRKRIKENLSRTVNRFLTKLQPLLARYNATHTDPITTRFIANHLDLDKLFDDVRIRITDGVLSLVNEKSGALIYSGSLTDIANGNFYPENIPPAPTAPAAPTGVTATGGVGQVTLAWAPVASATAYNVYFATSTGVTTANGTKLIPTTNGYQHTGLTAGATYYYIVTAVNAGGESAPSAQAQAAVAAAPAPTAPAAPAGVTAVGGTRQVTISWPAAAGATSYNIYWSTTPGVTTATGTKLGNATSPAVQAGLQDGTTYYYVVTAVNAAGESAASIQVAAGTLPAAPVPTPPGAVTGVAATGGQNQVSLSWQAVSGANSYNVYWSTTPGVTAATGTKIPGATSPYTVTGLSAGTTYYFVVTAQNGVGEGAASAQASAATNAPPPAIPTAPGGVTATSGANQVSVNWNAVTGATSYNIYWSTTSGVTVGTGTKITGATRPFVQTGLSAGTSYYYVVTAVNGSGESPASVQAFATTNPPPVVLPAAPSGVVATGGTNQVTITWPAVSTATSYNIYYSTASGVTKTSGSKIANATSPYLQTGLAAGATYYYVVTAANSAGEGAASAQVSATTAAPVVLDGQALYNQYCAGCHGTGKQGKTVAATQAAITGNVGGMGFLSTLSAAQLAAIASTTAPAPPPAPACGTCHAIPPAAGKHAFHAGFASCASCHGTGYSTTAVNAATHANGAINLSTTIGWNAGSRSCSNSCHGSKGW